MTTGVVLHAKWDVIAIAMSLAYVIFVGCGLELGFDEAVECAALC